MRTEYDAATSLDGFIATEDDGLDRPFPLGDPSASSYPSFIAEVGARASRTCGPSVAATWPGGSSTPGCSTS